jgi:hypothetical protein
VRNRWLVGGIVVGLAAIVIAVVASKLKDNDTSGNVQTTSWADSVCGGLADWKASITSLADVSGGTLTKASLQQKLADAQTATEQLVTELKALGRPDLAEGDQLKQELDSAADELNASYQSLKAGAQDALGASTPAAFLQGLAKLAPQFQKLLDQISATVADLRNANVAESSKAELMQAFDDADSCQSLSSGES